MTLPLRPRAAGTSAPASPPGPGNAAGPLDGLHVLEVDGPIAGAFATMLLADLGATVVRVEVVPACRVASRDRSVALGEAWPVALGHHKQSIAVDVDRAEGRELLDRLVRWADVVVESVLPNGQGSLRSRAGAGGERPGPTWCAVEDVLAPGVSDAPGGYQGDMADLLYQAWSGFMALTGAPGGAPGRMGLPLGELVAGIYAAIGVVASRLPEPPAQPVSTVEVTRADAAVALLSYMAVSHFADGSVPQRLGTGHPTIFPYNAFRARDGDLVVAPFTQAFWRNFCRGVGREDLVANPDFKDFAQRLRHRDVLFAELAPILAERSVEEWTRVLEEADVPCGPVLDVGQAMLLDQTRSRGMLRQREAADGGSERRLGSPFSFEYADGTTYSPDAWREPPDGPEGPDGSERAGRE